MKNKISRWKSIQFSFLLLVIISTLVVIGGLVAFANNRTYHATAVYKELEKKRIDSFASVSNLEGQNLKSLTVENTYWDEMVSFISNQDKDFEENILRSQLVTYDADVMWTYDTTYRLVSNTNVLPIKNSDFNLNFDQADLINIFKDDYLAHFYKNTDIGVIEVYGATVHPSSDVEHKTSPQGYFFIARILSRDYITNLELLTDDKITLVSSIVEKTDVKPEPKSGIINFKQDLKDENDNSVGQLDVQFYSAAVSGLLTSLNKLITAAMIFSIIISILFYSAFSKIIISPLAKIYRSLLTDDLTEIERLKSKDSEMGRVADLIDKSIKQKQEIAETAVRIQKSQSALESRTKEIEKINSLMIDRELKMIELKAEIKTLKSAQNL